MNIPLGSRSHTIILSTGNSTLNEYFDFVIFLATTNVSVKSQTECLLGSLLGSYCTFLKSACLIIY